MELKACIYVKKKGILFLVFLNYSENQKRMGYSVNKNPDHNRFPLKKCNMGKKVNLFQYEL
jgi:hypothetical protein